MFEYFQSDRWKNIRRNHYIFLKCSKYFRLNTFLIFPQWKFIFPKSIPLRGTSLRRMKAFSALNEFCISHVTWQAINQRALNGNWHTERVQLCTSSSGTNRHWCPAVGCQLATCIQSRSWWSGQSSPCAWAFHPYKQTVEEFRNHYISLLIKGNTLLHISGFHSIITDCRLIMQSKNMVTLLYKYRSLQYCYQSSLSL